MGCIHGRERGMISFESGFKFILLDPIQELVKVSQTSMILIIYSVTSDTHYIIYI